MAERTHDVPVPRELVERDAGQNHKYCPDHIALHSPPFRGPLRHAHSGRSQLPLRRNSRLRGLRLRYDDVRRTPRSAASGALIKRAKRAQSRRLSAATRCWTASGSSRILSLPMEGEDVQRYPHTSGDPEQIGRERNPDGRLPGFHEYRSGQFALRVPPSD